MVVNLDCWATWSDRSQYSATVERLWSRLEEVDTTHSLQQWIISTWSPAPTGLSLAGRIELSLRRDGFAVGLHRLSCVVSTSAHVFTGCGCIKALEVHGSGKSNVIHNLRYH